MLRHIETRHDFQADPQTRYMYYAKYENGHAIIAVGGGSTNPPGSDVLAHREFSDGKLLTFQDGYMSWLTEVREGRVYEADLTLRHDPDCLGELRMLCHLWLEENYKLFQRDEYILRNRHRFRELLDMEEVEFPHGLTYKVMELPPEKQTAEEFEKAIAVEQNPRFRSDLINKLKEYAIDDYVRGPYDVVERVSSIRLLECLGEKESAEKAKELLIAIHKEIGMFYYTESRTMQPLQPDPFIKVPDGSIDED